MDLTSSSEDFLRRENEDLRRKLAEAAARPLADDVDRRERLYGAILANTPDLAYVFDLDHRFIYANEGLLRMWGKTQEEALGKTCLELGYEQWHAEMHDREIDQVIATKQPIRGEVPFHGTFGRRIYDYIFVPVLGPTGEVEAVAGTTRDVTDSKMVADQLVEAAKSTAMVRSLFEQGTQFAGVLALDGTVLDVNRLALEACGFSREEVVGKLFWECGWWNRSHDLSEMVRRATMQARAGKPFKAETEYFLADGTMRFVELTIAPVTDEQDQVLFLSPTGVDITERKETEAALQQSQRFLERITDVTPGMLQVYDLELGKSVFINRSIPFLLGYSEEEIDEIGPDFMTALMHPNALSRLSQHVELVRGLADRQIADFEYRLRDREGNWRWFQSRDAVFERKENGDVRQIIRASFEITERKIAEEAQARLVAIVDSSYDAIVSKDLDGTIQTWNAAAEQLFGFLADEIVGQSITRIVPPDRLHEEHQILSRLRQGERCDNIETKRVRKDGQQIDVAITVSPLRDHNGVIVGASKIARDITESKRLKDQLALSNQLLEQRVMERTAQLEAFTYSIAHDMRMHIRGVKANIGMLLDDFRDLPQGLVNRLGKIDTSAGQLVCFVEGLLSYGRSSNSPLKRTQVDLSQIAADICRRITEDRGAEDRFEFDVAEGMHAVADPLLVGVVLQNLLDNAVKFRDPSRPLKVEVGVSDQDGVKTFFVRDNGIGFEQTYACKVFEPFERLKNDPRVPGSGIGLANVRRILERHGGHICVKAELGKGATFTFTFG